MIKSRNIRRPWENGEIAIVVGSHRKNSQSRKVADYILHRLMYSHGAPAAPMLLDLAELSMPLWDEHAWDQSEHWADTWQPVSRRLQGCAGVVVISPEWGGMAPAALKNFFLLCTSNELAHKAGLIVAVSSGLGGSYPVAELRLSSHKNTRLCYVPDHVIVRNAESALNDLDNAQSEDDQRIRARLDY